MQESKEKKNNSSSQGTKNQPTKSKPNVFGDNGMQDINQNLGKFSKDQQQKKPEIKIDPKHEINIKDIKINFDKFSHVKKIKIPQNSLSEKFNFFIQKKKNLFFLFFSELFLIFLFIAISITLLVKIYEITKPYFDDTPINFPGLKNSCSAGKCLNIINLCSLSLPIICLITAFFIGINQVISSKKYHFFTIFILIISFALLIAALTCTLIPYVEFCKFFHK